MHTKSSNDISLSSGIEPCIPKHSIEIQFAYHSARILGIEFMAFLVFERFEKIAIQWLAFVSGVRRQASIIIPCSPANLRDVKFE